MPTDPEGAGADVLRSKRDATRYQILVEIAEHQPAVSQQEIADAIGITAQAVSDYLQGLTEEGYVDKRGRGRYQVTKEGVDWLITRTERLRTFVDHVAEDVVGQVDVETVIATTPVREGERVSLTMREGVLRATAGGTEGATAVAVTDADPGRDVGITNVQGIVDYELGTVTVVSLPRVVEGGSAAVDPDRVADLSGGHDVVATAGTEALVAADRAGVEPDLRFGTAPAVREAATKGLDVLLLATTDELSRHTDQLREDDVGYEVVEASEVEVDPDAD